MKRRKWRKWTEAEKRLDEVLHDPELARKSEWRDRAMDSLGGCPANSDKCYPTPPEDAA